MIYVFSVIKGILVNIGDSTFSFATSQDPLVSKLTFKTTLEQKELSSNWCFKTLPTPAGTDLSPRFRDIRLIVCVGPPLACYQGFWDQPWCGLFWTLSIAHTSSSISCDSVIHECYWSVHHSDQPMLAQILVKYGAKVDVPLCEI